MPKLEKVIVHVADLPQFRRLVTFVDEVRLHAEEHGDEDLKELLRQLAADLLEDFEI